MNRPDISRLKKNRAIFLKIGLMSALCMVIFAFNITVYEYENTDYVAVNIDDDDIDPVLRTAHESKPKFVPPVLKPTDNIIPDDHKFVEDPIPEPIDTEIKVDTQIMQRPMAPVFVNRPKAPVIIEKKETKKTEPPIFVVVEEMPRFPGCEDSDLSKKEKKACADKALLNYIYSKIKYPRLAKDAGIEGTVLLNFVIEKNGKITNVEIVREIGGGCGREVVRVVNEMPDWIPGKQRNQEVRVRFNMPVKFKLD